MTCLSAGLEVEGFSAGGTASPQEVPPASRTSLELTPGPGSFLPTVLQCPALAVLRLST